MQMRLELLPKCPLPPCLLFSVVTHQDASPGPFRRTAYYSGATNSLLCSINILVQLLIIKNNKNTPGARECISGPRCHRIGCHVGGYGCTCVYFFVS
jgi:hypothetical protein